MVCFVALSVSLPMAWISLAKVLLFAIGLVYLFINHASHRRDDTLSDYLFPSVILISLIAFATSLVWTVADLDTALMTLVKHAKLLEIVLLVSLIRTKREALIGITAFALGQFFLLACSWLMAVGVPIALVHNPTGKYVVFSTYLDQSIMFAASAGVFWNLRSVFCRQAWVGAVIATAALVNVLLLLEGRTGYATALTVLSLLVMWAMPKRIRLVTLIVTPALILAGLFLGSTQVQERVSKIVRESQNYAKQTETDSSSGWRLNAWHRSVQAIEESPWYGHGVGSWTITVKRLQGDTAAKTFGSGNSSNPHQEYLLWGVELGLAGTLLFMAFLVSCLWDARRFPTGSQRALYSVVAAMAVACLFNSTLYDGLIGDFFSVAIGLLMALGIRSTPQAMAA